MLFKIVVLKNFAVFTRKHPCWNLKACNKKETLTQLFCCEYCKIFKSNYFEEHLGTCTSVVNYLRRNKNKHYISKNAKVFKETFFHFNHSVRLVFSGFFNIRGNLGYSRSLTEEIRLF